MFFWSVLWVVFLRFAFIAVDEGGVIDTIEYNQGALAFTPRDKEEYKFLLQALINAFQVKDLKFVGEMECALYKGARVNVAFIKIMKA